MNFEIAVDMIAKRLGQRQDLVSDIREQMQFVQDYILETDPLRLQFQLSERQNAWTDLGDDRVALPPLFLGEYEEGALFLIREGGSVKPLLKEDLQQLVNKYGDTPGEPVFYARTGSYFRLYPIPNTQYQIRMLNYERAAVLTDGEENYWLANAADWMIAETGKVMAAQFLMNSPLAKIFHDQSTNARQRLWRAHEASLNVNRDMIKGA